MTDGKYKVIKAPTWEYLTVGKTYNVIFGRSDVALHDNKASGTFIRMWLIREGKVVLEAC